VKHKIEKFLSNATIFYIDEIIEKKAIEIKQKHKIETPDGIIGATALVNEMTLITRNEVDFKKISGLKIYNPFNE